MLTMTRAKVNLSGYIKRKFDDAEIAALIDDLDLVPAFLITPKLVQMYRRELRDRYLSHEFEKVNVELAIAYTVELLSSEYGKEKIQFYRDKFQGKIPFNREY